jgi:DNA polymerase III delta prime subunit
MIVSDKAVRKLDQLLAAIEAEYQFEKNEAVDAIKNIPLKVLKEQGKCLYPLMVKRIEYDKAEYVVVEFEWTNDAGYTHQFQPGRKARIFTTKDQTLFIEGTVSKAGKDYIKISTRLDEEPDWIHEGKIGVYLLHDDFTFREAIKAVKAVKDSSSKKINELVELVYGEEEFKSVNEEGKQTHHNDLNALQNKAVSIVQHDIPFFLLHGPPGTGKSTTLAYAIREKLNSEKQILFCAPSNTAVDVMTEKLRDLGINVLRIGNPVKISRNTIESSLDYKVIHHPDQKNLKDLKKRAEELHRMAGKYKRVFGKEEREHRKLLYTEAKKMTREVIEHEEQLERSLLSEAQVICCTPALSNAGFLEEMRFETLFFDEASQATDPLVWIPLLKCNKIILAGDHLQLGPTIKSKEATEKGLDKTMFEQGMTKNAPHITLAVQYRMHELIMGFSNKQFYSNQLVADDAVKQHRLKGDITSPILFIDTAGAGYNESSDDKSTSIKNDEEANFILNYLKEFFTQCEEPFSCGIVSPYSAQVNLIKSLLPEEWKNVMVSTVDGFQGQEKDMIIVSCVRSNESNEIGFLKDYRRMNVALTRARKKLVVVGDSATLAKDDFYNEMINYVEKAGGYDSVWNYSFDV